MSLDLLRAGTPPVGVGSPPVLQVEQEGQRHSRSCLDLLLQDAGNPSRRAPHSREVLEERSFEAAPSAPLAAGLLQRVDLSDEDLRAVDQDVRAPVEANLQQGRQLRILEHQQRPAVPRASTDSTARFMATLFRFATRNSSSKTRSCAVTRT